MVGVIDRGRKRERGFQHKQTFYYSVCSKVRAINYTLPSRSGCTGGAASASITSLSITISDSYLLLSVCDTYSSLFMATLKVFADVMPTDKQQ